MFHRPSLRSTVTTLAAAAVLVGGADLASYAASGHPLILGHANSAGTTTSLKNTGRGPALSLNSAKSTSPLVVNSSKMVKHLNAAMVGGKTAGQLVPKTLRFHIGSLGTNFAGGTANLVTVNVPKGTYEISMSGLVTDSTGTTDSYTCLVLDKAALLAAIGGGSLDYSRVYGLDGDSQGNFKFGVVDYTNPAQKVSRSSVALGCAFNGIGPFVEQRLLTFTFRPITVSDQRNGAPIPLPRSAAQRLSRAMR